MTQSNHKIKVIGDLSLKKGEIELAIECYKNIDDLNTLLMIYSSLKLPKQLTELAQRAEQVTLISRSWLKWTWLTCATTSPTTLTNALTFSSNRNGSQRQPYSHAPTAQCEFQSAWDCGKKASAIRASPRRYLIPMRKIRGKNVRKRREKEKKRGLRPDVCEL